MSKKKDDGKVLTLPPPPPNQQAHGPEPVPAIVVLLERLLREARGGHLREFAFAGVTINGIARGLPDGIMPSHALTAAVGDLMFAVGSVRRDLWDDADDQPRAVGDDHN